MSALALHLRRERWQFFLNCTYRHEASMREAVRYPMMFQFLRKVAELGKLKFSRQLTWAVREEHGEKTQRLHWHGLVTGLPPHIVTPTTCNFLQGYWEGIGGGMARIFTYDTELDAVGYCLKGLDESFSAGQAYEMDKFSTADKESGGLIIARAALRQWSRSEVNDRSTRAQDMRKAPRCDRSTGGVSHRIRPGNPTHPADAVGRLYV